MQTALVMASLLLCSQWTGQRTVVDWALADGHSLPAHWSIQYRECLEPHLYEFDGVWTLYKHSHRDWPGSGLALATLLYVAQSMHTCNSCL